MSWGHPGELPLVGRTGENWQTGEPYSFRGPEPGLRIGLLQNVEGRERAGKPTVAFHQCEGYSEYCTAAESAAVCGLVPGYS